MPIDYEVAKATLESRFSLIESNFISGQDAQEISGAQSTDFDAIFHSATQAYREVLIGCLLARLQDKTINIRQPYVNLGEHAFNGWTLDERVINPFLHEKRNPSSRGPYLSVFRRSVTLEPRGGLRDVTGYDALLRLISIAESTADDSVIHSLLDAVLFRFIRLREESEVPLNRLQRFSLEQYRSLIDCLLQTPSGGRYPLFIVVAVFRALNLRFALSWDVSYQGINVADKASGVAGDVTVSIGSDTVISAEITERRVDRSRVVSTFNAKIGPAAAKDYLFFIMEQPDKEAKEQAHRYFAQGHAISFVEIPIWTGMILATLGQEGRELFNKELLNLLESPDVPKTMKVGWNSCAENAIESD